MIFGPREMWISAEGAASSVPTSSGIGHMRMIADSRIEGEK
jgi:hypothetical protein